MNPDLIIVHPSSTGKTTRIMQMMALCQIATRVEGMTPIFEDLGEARRERERLAERLSQEAAIHIACTEANLEPEFFRKESAYERRNRGAPWYRRFDRKRRR